MSEAFLDKAKVYQAFFLEAAFETYAAEKPSIAKTTIPELPGSKVYRYEHDNLLYIDIYFTNGPNSGGQTVIYERTWSYESWKPVWISQYHGWCADDNKEVHAFLKRALTDAYGKRQFVGGRGAASYIDDLGSLGYYNSARGDFFLGNGTERILPLEGTEILFWHNYQHYILTASE